MVGNVRRVLASLEGQRRARLLRRRLRECEGALEELERDEGWKLCQRLFGVDTYFQYVQEESQGDGAAGGGRLALRVKLVSGVSRHNVLCFFDPLSVIGLGPLAIDT